MNILLLFLIFTLVQLVQLVESNAELQTKQGALRGTFRKTWGGRSFLAFQGIPYAKPPVGHRRFQPPEPLTTWEGILDATKSHEPCPQRDIFFGNQTIFGNEDCLFLNVYTPQITETTLLPVIVYIHGGGFMTDSGNPNLYGPDIFLDKDIVMATINYRLGALGFLSLEDEILPGNNGLKDQNLALRWIKNNINSFGGDPNRITIFGNSAGGASVYYQMLSPLSKGLFHAVVSSSGIATCPWAMAQKGEAKRSAKKLATFLDCPTSSSQAILECLQNVQAYTIVRQNDKFLETHEDSAIPHKPVIEPKIPGAFLTDHPIDIIKSGEFAQVPYMTGITTDDGALISAALYNNYTFIEQLNKDFDFFSPIILHYEHHSFKEQISRKVRKFYFQDKAIDKNTKTELTDAVTDALWYFPQRLTSQLHSKYTSQPIYFYLFGYKGSVTVSKFFGDSEQDYGVGHCDDLTYLLSNEFFENYIPTKDDLKMNDIMTTLLYNFATTGNPTPEINSLITSKWEPLRSNGFKYYEIISPSRIRTETKLYEERYKFWKDLGVSSNLDKIKDEL